MLYHLSHQGSPNLEELGLLPSFCLLLQGGAERVAQGWTPPASPEASVSEQAALPLPWPSSWPSGTGPFQVDMSPELGLAAQLRGAGGFSVLSLAWLKVPMHFWSGLRISDNDFTPPNLGDFRGEDSRVPPLFQILSSLTYFLLLNTVCPSGLPLLTILTLFLEFRTSDCCSWKDIWDNCVLMNC